ncbi:MFS general substrate transporter [Saccharata proteae CBS 121410]|uniref:MFS general substrate transporter n=1 Tax=Saccharata proteae CBS 121410 TaxID=1314787 RepID=A0A9P4LU39_9PEZI|nr:MFS general substrate transporter [Saccharata proteae CBS 121410]
MNSSRLKPELSSRKSSTLHYQTFPTNPPTSRGRPPSPSAEASPSRQPSSDSAHHGESPLPKKQLAILAIIALAEQTALNSISPYLPDMASTFPEVEETKVGLYVGLIASSFAFAQFGTNFFWGWLSDRIGRKPVILLGTLFTAGCFVAFGFCKTLWQAILVQILMGLLNGNQGVVSTCLGEITDRSNQSRAFTYLPVVYGLGGITGPIVGGLMVFKEDPFHKGHESKYPYLAPNLFSGAILVIDLILTMIFLDETLEEAQDLPPLGKRVGSLFTWFWQFASSSRNPTYIRRMVNRHKHKHSHDNAISANGVAVASDDESDDEDDSQDSAPALFPNVSNGEHLSRREVLNRDTILLLLTFLIFQFANISYNSLYPIFAQAPPPTGRNLNPEEIGISLAFAGVVTIIFQVGIYGKLREKIGNKTTYRVSLAAFVVAFILMPWVGYKNGEGTGLGLGTGKVAMWVELGFVLIIKTVAAVGGLTSALLLITNSAPNHSVLGTLNGLAQTLSAAGRAVGPFISGALFSAATRIQPKGEAMAFGVFGGIAFLGFLLSFGIRGAGLEAEGWDEEEGEDEDDDYDEDEEEGGNERSGLLRRR